MPDCCDSVRLLRRVSLAGPGLLRDPMIDGVHLAAGVTAQYDCSDPSGNCIPRCNRAARRSEANVRSFSLQAVAATNASLNNDRQIHSRMPGAVQVECAGGSERPDRL